MQSRRVFLGSTAALGVVGAASVFRVSAQDHAHAPADPVQAELRQQLIAGVRALEAGGGGEPARRIGGILRVATAAGIARQFDARLRAAVRRHGRDAILLQNPDLEKFAADVKVFGLTEPPPLTPSSYEERARVLNAVLARGVGPLFEAAAQRFETLASDLDRRMVLPVAQPSPYDRCWVPCAEVFALEVIVLFACLGSAVDSGIACLFLTGMLVGLKIGYALQGCLC